MLQESSALPGISRHTELLALAIGSRDVQVSWLEEPIPGTEELATAGRIDPEFEGDQAEEGPDGR